MPTFRYKIKSIKSIFGLSSSMTSNLSELKKKIKRKKYVENFITLKTKAKINNENDDIKNLSDSKAKAKINNENDAIKNPFDLKTKAKINTKNDF